MHPANVTADVYCLKSLLLSLDPESFRIGANFYFAFSCCVGPQNLVKIYSAWRAPTFEHLVFIGSKSRNLYAWGYYQKLKWRFCPLHDQLFEQGWPEANQLFANISFWPNKEIPQCLPFHTPSMTNYPFEFVSAFNFLFMTWMQFDVHKYLAFVRFYKPFLEICEYYLPRCWALTQKYASFCAILWHIFLLHSLEGSQCAKKPPAYVHSV